MALSKIGVTLIYNMLFNYFYHKQLLFENVLQNVRLNNKGVTLIIMIFTTHCVNIFALK